MHELCCTFEGQLSRGWPDSSETHKTTLKEQGCAVLVWSSRKSRLKYVVPGIPRDHQRDVLLSGESGIQVKTALLPHTFKKLCRPRAESPLQGDCAHALGLRRATSCGNNGKAQGKATPRSSRRPHGSVKNDDVDRSRHDGPKTGRPATVRWASWWPERREAELARQEPRGGGREV